MIIKNADGRIIDTDTLPDVNAMIAEKCEELRILCCNEKRQLVIVVDSRGNEDGHLSTFWNIKGRKYNDNDQNTITRSYNQIISMLNGFISTISNGNLGIFSKNKNENE